MLIKQAKMYIYISFLISIQNSRSKGLYMAENNLQDRFSQPDIKLQMKKCWQQWEIKTGFSIIDYQSCKLMCK